MEIYRSREWVHVGFFFYVLYVSSTCSVMSWCRPGFRYSCMACQTFWKKKDETGYSPMSLPSLKIEACLRWATRQLAEPNLSQYFCAFSCFPYVYSKRALRLHVHPKVAVSNNSAYFGSLDTRRPRSASSERWHSIALPTSSFSLRLTALSKLK